ncbi:uncharacterized protein LOC144438585 [Glandiceps talaboti]
MSTFATSMTEARELLLYASLAINGSILWYFTVFICIDKGLTCVLRRRASQWLRILHTCHSAFARRFYIDSVVQPTLCLIGFYLLFTTDVLEKPFSGPIDKKTSIVLSVTLGSYLFRSFRELFTFGKVSNFKSTIFHHVVTVITYAVILDTKENGIFGVVGLILEGGTTFIEFGKYLKKLRKRDKTYYKVLKFFGLVLTIILRGVVPVVTLAVSTSTESPFVMTYISVIMFFTSGLLIGIINFYHIEAVSESAFKQWFCDTVRSRDRGNAPTDEIWQQRYNLDDVDSFPPSIPYMVSQPNVYETVNHAPNVNLQSTTTTTTTTINNNNNVSEDSIDKTPENELYVSLCKSDNSSILDMNTINELKHSGHQNTATIRPNYGTCNHDNTGTVDVTSKVSDIQQLVENSAELNIDEQTQTDNSTESV